MSDDEYEYEYESGEEEYVYDDSDEEGGDEGDDAEIEIENAFYEADDIKGSEPLEALKLFQRVVDLEKELRGSEVKLRFKALENIVQLQLKLDDFDSLVESYTELLSYIGEVTRNECTEAINGTLDGVASKDSAIVSRMYDITLGVLKAAGNERLWFNTTTKLGNIYLEKKEFKKLQQLLDELYASCRKPDGSDDPNKATYLLEVLALEVAFCTVTNRWKRMKEIYPKTLNLDAAIADPRTMGGVRESGGKLYMLEKKWKQAYDELFEAVRNYQEAGNSRARNCLKYLLLANMLAGSDINPFDAREAKAFKDDAEIVAIADLRRAYEDNDVHEFERVLRVARVEKDPFMKKYVDDLLKNVRCEVLVKIIQPYKVIRLSFLAGEINVSAEEVEELLVELILDRRLVGRIDQLGGCLHLSARAPAASKKHDALSAWVEQIAALQSTLAQRMP